MPKYFEDKVNTYLWYAYLPPRKISLQIRNNDASINRCLVYSPKEAADVFDRIMNKLLNNEATKNNLLPLSGGYDSRAILGALLERFDSSQIDTVTFGAPGQLDYDIGQNIAKVFGVKSHVIDLRSIQFSWMSLVASVKKSPWTYVPDGYFNMLARDVLFGQPYTVWSGFLGDPLTGSHLSQTATTNEAQVEFVNKQKRTKGLNLCESSYEPLSALPYISEIEYISPYAVLDLGVRQSLCIAPIVTSAPEWISWDPFFSNTASDNHKYPVIVTPFSHPEWANYWLSAPRPLLQGQKLYLEMLKLKFPKLFAMPSKATMGLSPNATYALAAKRVGYLIKRKIQVKLPYLNIKANLLTNYLDYDQMFRSRKDYQETLEIAFEYLKTHKITPWLDLDEMRRKHLKKNNNYGDAFMVLIGLAANLYVDSQFSISLIR